MSKPSVKAVRYFRDQAASLAFLGVLATISAFSQAIALVLIVPLANAISSGKQAYHGTLAGVHFDVSTGSLALMAAIAILIAAIIDITIAWKRARVMTRWEFQRREAVVGEFLQADFATQAGERLGTLGTLTGYVNRGSSALGAIVNGLEALLTIAIFVAGAIFINWRAALFLIGTLAVLSLVLRPVIKLTRRYSRALSAILIEYGREVTETTRMARDARIFNAMRPLGAQLTDRSREVASVRRRAVFVNGVSTPIYQYLGLLLIVGALVVADEVHSLNLAEFGAIALLLLRSMSFGQQFQNAYQLFTDSMPYVERLEAVRADYLEHATTDGTVALEAVHRLDLDDVRFSYDGQVEALAGVSASFQLGEMVGIVGPSGGGKSTLSQLILRLREPTSGAIRINRMDASEYSLGSWYRHVSLVPQDPRLFHATVADNISFLDPAIDRDHVIAAAKAAGVHEVIEALDEGYETKIGPAFRDLSGGQIQRIGIARALARGAQVLVLDEPTSALDVHSEGVIQATLEGLRGKVLVLIIAHRLSTLSICDRILVLQQGRVETAGSLADVSERSDFFRRALDAGTLDVGVADRSTAALPDDM